MKPLLVTSGEPAGIGPDLCVGLAAFDFPIVVLGDPDVLMERARELDVPLKLHEYTDAQVVTNKNHLSILPLSCGKPVVAGQLCVDNANYVVTMLNTAVTLCLQGAFNALVTAPVHKGIINQAGY